MKKCCLYIIVFIQKSDEKTKNKKQKTARLKYFFQDRNIYNKLFLRYIIDKEVQLTKKIEGKQNEKKKFHLD